MWHEEKLSVHQLLSDFDSDALKFWVSPSHALAVTPGCLPLMKNEVMPPDEGSLEGPGKQERWGRILGVFSFSSVVQTNWDEFLTLGRKWGWATFQRLDFHISDHSLLSFATSFYYFNSYLLSCLLSDISVCSMSSVLHSDWCMFLSVGNTETNDAGGQPPGPIIISECFYTHTQRTPSSSHAEIYCLSHGTVQI